MRLEKVAFAIVLGLCVTAQAQENVYVDLSVLDNLDGFVGAPAEPLFPIVKPKPKKAVVKKPVQKAKVAKKAVEPMNEQPKAEFQQEHQPIPYVESTEGIVVVNTEPAAVEPEMKKSEVETAVQSEKPVVTETPVEMPAKQGEKAPVNQPKAAQPVDVQPEQQAAQPELLVEETPAMAEPTSGKIIFNAEEDEISPEQMSQIDEIVGRFKNTDKNKIAIYAYNLDNGVDTFKRKRISLNRAVNIRGYLIKQGHKNFSIKVVNVEADSDKVNTVELEEI